MEMVVGVEGRQGPKGNNRKKKKTHTKNATLVFHIMSQSNKARDPCYIMFGLGLFSIWTKLYIMQKTCGLSRGRRGRGRVDKA